MTLSINIIKKSFDFYNIYIPFLLIGAPSNFCQGKTNGLFGNPNNREEFFQCTDGQSSLCQTCPATLMFSDNCGMCIYPTSSKLLLNLYFYIQ